MIRKVSTSVIWGNTQIPKAVSSPISSAARNAPSTLPMPPTTTTTKASAMILQVHVVGDRVARQLERAAERGQAGAEREHRGEQPGLVDAERADHLAVLGRGAHQDAPAGAPEQPGERAEHGRAEGDQHQLVLRETLAEDRDRAGEARRPRPDLVLRSPDDDHQLPDDQHHAEGREQLEQLGRLVDPAQQQDLDQRAERGDEQGGEQSASQKPSAELAPASQPVSVTAR